MAIEVVTRSACRLCYAERPTKVFEFSSIPFFDEVVPLARRGSEFSHPMGVYFCEYCNSLQSQHDVNFNEYYGTYQYVGSRSTLVKRYLEALTTYCCESLGLGGGDSVVEIGSADGYLLSLFESRGLRTIGFEAAANLCEIAAAEGRNVINTLFTRESFHFLPADFTSVQLVVMLHTFDHLADPAPILDLVGDILDPERGVLVLEVHDLAEIYVKREAALFGHEHATYLHFSSMRRLLGRHGLRLVDFNFIPSTLCRGSSMTVAATPVASNIPSVDGLERHERPILDSLPDLERFGEAVGKAFVAFREYLEDGIRRGQRFAGYGGWGRGVTTLALANVTADHLRFVADANPNLAGCFTPVSGIPIARPEAIMRSAVDEVVVFNYAYMDEIRETLGEYISSGGRVVSVLELLK